METFRVPLDFRGISCIHVCPCPCRLYIVIPLNALMHHQCSVLNSVYCTQCTVLSVLYSVRASFRNFAKGEQSGRNETFGGGGAM